MNKKELIKHLETIAVYLEIKGENSFKVSAYRKAAQALEQDERSLAQIEAPSKLSGIGKGTAAIIEEIRTTGTSDLLETLKAEVPSGLIPLLQLPGLGGKKIAKLYKELEITDAATLQKACEEKKIQKLAGFGAKTEENIAKALEEMNKRPERLPISFMLEAARQLEQELNNIHEVKRYERAGSLRRMEEMIKDLDYIIAVDDPEPVRKALTESRFAQKIIADGLSKVSIECDFGMPVQVDFRLVDDQSFATTLHHFTGSKEHNVQIRQLAKKLGQKVSEYGIEDTETGELYTFSTESEFFSHFGLHYIPPEARIGKDELRLFEKPYELLSLSHIRGDLHMHTTWSDGAESIEEMAEAGREKGYEWMAITDHSKFLQVAHGLNEERVLRQIEEIKRINNKYDDFHLLAGIEMDIRPDGTLDLDEYVLKELDVVIASIHSSFNQSETEIMNRLEAALNSPYVNIIAHPTGRLIGRREGYKVNVDSLIRRAGETGTALELNANPNRLDLSAEWLRKASEHQTNITINTDAHHTGTMNHMEIGVSIGKKALLTPEQVINTWTYSDLIAFFTHKRQELT
ncbi:DNA polymerase/3'-5' exonuclease PolX [Alteribacillus iranensis]|uniref:DNA-directed DNA polymerase n=1 Tax=Alteribacillus iranensis TaxID=930128 RepID=A0A1I2CL46_9BACI|nr:DNA polymerase/3'-5' exonuclease PolX [Alteribacillus iranensis]SFE69119.1 DNA polymerase (family 10) [Alteribacillus iranensis]